jgi:hypothetical protein
MKRKIQLLVVMLFVAFTSFAQTQMVTFQVESPDSTPVYVFGGWSGWGNWPGTPMTLIAPNKYSVTIPIASNTTHEYLFVNGATPVKEILNPSWSCTNGNATYTNRVLALGAADTAVCYTFATCNTCTVTPPPPPPSTVNVTFQVESPDSTPVSLIGSWNWNNWPGASMTAVTATKYSVTMPLLPNSPYEFLFVNGATPTKEVLNPAWSCTNGNAQYTNRTLNLGANDTTICFTWATCTSCPVAPPPSNINVTFQVESPDSTPVSLIGSWNWSSFPGASMSLISGTKYSVTLPLLANSTHEFLFVNGATPTKEVLNPAWACTNGNAQYTNRTLSLGNADTTICFTWATCNSCTITPPPSNVNITFQVENPDSTPVYVFGSWSNWGNFPGDLMTSLGSGKYEITLPLAANNNYEYLYVNGSAKEVLNPAWTCTNGNGQYTNRTLAVGSTDFTKCNKWALCDSCGAVTPSNINVKFAVQATDSTPVYVFGSWSNWSNFPGTPMTYNSAKGTYEATIPMAASAAIEYLYVNGVGTKEVLDPSWTCTNGNSQYTNRIATLGTTDTAFCNRWQSCATCFPLAIGNAASDVVTILVDNQSVKVSSSSFKQLDQLEIFDIVGKRIFTSNGKINTNENIPVSLQNNTMYIVRVKNANTYYKVKAIIKN